MLWSPKMIKMSYRFSAVDSFLNPGVFVVIAKLQLGTPNTPDIYGAESTNMTSSTYASLKIRIELLEIDGVQNL